MQAKKLLVISYAYDFRDDKEVFAPFIALQPAFPQLFSRIKAGVWIHGLRKAVTSADLASLTQKVAATGANQLQVALPKLNVQIAQDVTVHSFNATIDISPLSSLWSSLKEGLPKSRPDHKSRRHFATRASSAFRCEMQKYPTITKVEFEASVPSAPDPSELLSEVIHEWIGNTTSPESLVGHAGYHDLTSVSHWLDAPFSLYTPAYEYIDRYPDKLHPVMFRPKQQLERIGSILGYSKNIKNVRGKDDSTAVMWLPQSVARSSLSAENTKECVIPIQLYEGKGDISETKGEFRFLDHSIYYTKPRWEDLARYELSLKESHSALEELPHPKYANLIGLSSDMILVRSVAARHLELFEAQVDQNYENSPVSLSPLDRVIGAYKKAVDSTDMFRSERFALAKFIERLGNDNNRLPWSGSPGSL